MNKARLLGRVRRIRGQLAALENQLEQDDGCTPVLQQIAAVRGAVNGLMLAVMESHITEHLVEEPDSERRALDLEPVLQIVRSYLK